MRLIVVSLLVIFLIGACGGDAPRSTPEQCAESGGIYWIDQYPSNGCVYDVRGLQ